MRVRLGSQRFLTSSSKHDLDTDDICRSLRDKVEPLMTRIDGRLEDSSQKDAARELAARLEPLKEEYDANKDELETFTTEVVNRLDEDVRREFPSEYDHRLIRVTGRVKGWDSIKAKIEAGVLRKEPLTNCGDLIGIKIIALTTQHIGKIEDALLGYRRRDTIQRRSWWAGRGRARGYAATHVQIDIPRGLSPPPMELELGIEVQVLTELQQIWDLVTHDDFYKPNEGVPSESRNRVYRLSAALDLLDGELAQITAALHDERRKITEALTEAARKDDGCEGFRLDEVALLTVTKEPGRHLYDDFLDLRDLARDCGFKASAWTELVKPGDEVTRFMVLAEEFQLQTLGELKETIDRAKLNKAKLSEIRSTLDSRTPPDTDWLFDRPLTVLGLTLLLKDPLRGAIPGSIIADEVASAVAEVAYREQDG